MEFSQTMEEKSGFLQLLKESVRIPLKNPIFIIFIFFTSIPLFCSLCMYEITFQNTLIELGKSVTKNNRLLEDPFEIFDNDFEVIMKVSQKFLLLGLMYIGLIHFLDLLNTIAVVDITSAIYKEEKIISLSGMFSRFTKETRLKGPLITSIYVLLLASLIQFVLFSLAPYICMISLSISLFPIFLMVLIIALLAKYIEWSAIWNMGIVISILEEKQGDVAIVISSYLSRGSRVRGFVVMLMFFAWRIVLRLLCLYAGWEAGGIGVTGTAVNIGLVCLMNVGMWVIFVVYFYDCKKRSSERKVAAEEEGSAVAQSL